MRFFRHSTTVTTAGTKSLKGCNRLTRSFLSWLVAWVCFLRVAGCEDARILQGNFLIKDVSGEDAFACLLSVKTRCLGKLSSLFKEGIVFTLECGNIMTFRIKGSR